MITLKDDIILRLIRYKKSFRTEVYNFCTWGGHKSQDTYCDTNNNKKGGRRIQVKVKWYFKRSILN